MDKSQITQVEANLPECDEVLLSDSCAVLSDRATFIRSIEIDAVVIATL